MPSSWSSRLLSSGHGSSTSPSSHRNKLPPRPPNETPEPSTLNPDCPVSMSPARQRAHTARQRTHSRSASHPLPKIFGRKKSNPAFHDTDVPLDDELVPVLDESSAKSGPTRVISGKKNNLDEDGKCTRRCMCCDSNVKVPRELPRFRCLACLTINDLKPVQEQSEEEKRRPQIQRTGTDPGRPEPPRAEPSISIERTRAIIDRCLAAYLEARCRRREAGVSPREDVFGPGHAAIPPVPKSFQDGRENRSLEHPSLVTTPPTVTHDGAAYFPQETLHDPSVSDQHTATSDTPERKAVSIPTRPTRMPPPPPLNLVNRRPSHNLLPPPNGSLSPNGFDNSPRKQHVNPRLTAEELEQKRYYDRIKLIFRPLEDYMSSGFGDFQCLNTSFSTTRNVAKRRTRSESEIKPPVPESAEDWFPNSVDGLSELDAKTLLLGDIGENSTWWTGSDRKQSDKATRRKKVGESSLRPVTSKSPNINFGEVESWYNAVHYAGVNWRAKRDRMRVENAGLSTANLEGKANTESIEHEISDARQHAIRTLLKITENMLKRPSRPLKEPEDLRWLLIILANPSLYPSTDPRRVRTGGEQHNNRATSHRHAESGTTSPRHSSARFGSQHNGLLKRIFGLLANAPENCHRYLVGWYARLDEDIFVKTVDLVASFVTYRIDRRVGRPRRASGVVDGGLIPDLSGSAMNTSAQLHSALGLSGSVKKGKEVSNAEPEWTGDWQIKAAASVMSMLFAANNIWQGRRRVPGVARIDAGSQVDGHPPGANAKRSGQLLHTSSFYNTLLDYQDMIADFKVWESRREKFSFCQYPLFLSIGNKIKILEYDARRQMELKAREAYFDQVLRSRPIDGHFHLRVRRDCLVDDSLRQISEAVGAGTEELKKGLRVHFTGEEGVDAGGPRKEWFLMIVRDIFDPNHGMFVYDDESHTCYFNPASFETSDQYYLVGALLGLAIYNSTILDVALPPFAFRKLLAAAPTSNTGVSNSHVSTITGVKGQMTYTLRDLAEFRPSLAAGLQQLLDFEGDVEATYCRDFVASVERYGVVSSVPLIPNGEKIAVTNANRHEFVNAYVRYLLDTAVSRQFEPFKRGFFTVCAGNALSLFRAEEIELLVRGSDESLDVNSLRAVAQYENWKHFQPPHAMIPNPAETVPVIGWFWELFAAASAEQQRKLLTFITGSDRIPAVGATSLILRIQAGGDGWGGGGKDERQRFPVARTCFNMLVLWRYDYREQLEEKLWRAVDESEGFGLK